MDNQKMSASEKRKADKALKNKEISVPSNTTENNKIKSEKSKTSRRNYRWAPNTNEQNTKVTIASNNENDKATVSSEEADNRPSAKEKAASNKNEAKKPPQHKVPTSKVETISLKASRIGDGPKKVSIDLGDNNKTEFETGALERVKIVIIINNQYSNAPNTTQIASGAGRSSAAGNNAAIDSSNTEQQQSVGSGGEADNIGMKGEQSQPPDKCGHKSDKDEVVIVVNNQIHNVNEGTESAASQIASGGGTYSTGGTNAALESANTKQQHAVGATDGRALNKGMINRQEEEDKHHDHDKDKEAW